MSFSKKHNHTCSLLRVLYAPVYSRKYTLSFPFPFLFSFYNLDSLSQWSKSHRRKCWLEQTPKAYWTGSAPTSQPEKSSMDIPTGRQRQLMLAPLSTTSLSVFNPKAKRAGAATVLLCVDIKNLPTVDSHHKVDIIIPIL